MTLLSTRETIGFWAGQGLGAFTGALSWVRQARMFHPRGMTYVGQVTSLYTAEGVSELKLPSYVLMRFSSAWWKNKEWPDVLGLALRFSDSSNFTETPRAGDQDLLFATITHPLTMGVAPLFTHVKDFLKNSYYAVSPFNVESLTDENLIKFCMVPANSSPEASSRKARLQAAVDQGAAIFELRWLRRLPSQPSTTWQPIAKVQVLHEIVLDQGKLKFDPFLNGIGIHPRGLVHFLRKGAYKMSQLTRPSHE